MSRSLNWVIFVLSVLLAVVSLALVQSLEPELVVQQSIFFMVGFTFFFLLSRLDYRILKPFGWYWWGLVVLSLVVTFIFGRATRQTVRWVHIGSLSLQPSELTKPFLILFLASFLADRKPRWLHIARIGFFVAIPAGLIFFQPDLGSALLFIFIWLCVMYFWLDAKKLSLLFLGVTLVSVVGWGLLRDYQKERLKAFIDPTSDPLGSGYHLIQAKIAAGSGRLFGRGLLRGTQSHLQFLPERHTDFIFAALGEELGFLGSFLIVVLYFFLLAQILRVARRSRDAFGFFICVGVFAFLFFQVIINIGMNIGLMPITGVTLPLISTGGSSIVSILVCLGLVESVARQQRSGQIFAIG